MQKSELAARLTELEARVRMLEAQIDALQQQQVPIVGEVTQLRPMEWRYGSGPPYTLTITSASGSQ